MRLLISRKHHFKTLSGLRPLQTSLCLCTLLAASPLGAIAQTDAANWTAADPQQELATEPANDINAAAVEAPADEFEASSGAIEDDDVLQEALEAAEPKDPSRTATISNRRLVRQIDNQFKAISELMKHEDAFSPKVGEHYFSYATLLLQAAQFEEAQEAFTTALHVQKVNNGIYALEQRPALKGLFETMFLQGRTMEFEEYLNRIIWIENQHRDYRDNFTFELLVKAGNFYIDQFLVRPIAGETGMEMLRKANRYLTYAIQRYGDAPLAEMFMPYGELALVHTLERKVFQRAKTNPFESSRARSDFERQNLNKSYLSRSLSRGEFFLKKYLAKAKTEKAVADIASALLQLGDLNLLFNRNDTANLYYEMAWAEIQNLPADHELRYSIATPVQLPAFSYAQARGFVPATWPTKLVPMTFSVNDSGKVEKIQPLQDQDENFEFFSKARAAARRLTFRPAIIDGKSVSSDGVTHGVRVKLNRLQIEQMQAQAQSS